MRSDRTNIPRNFLRKYLDHIQYSVFEGEVTEGQYEEILGKLEQEVSDDESIILYKTYSESYVERRTLGEDKDRDNFL